MAESRGLSGTPGEDTQSPADGSVPETPLDPTAAALAAEVVTNDPELAQKASAYFDKQTHLVEVQTEHLHEQRAVNLQLLKLRRLDERLRVGLRVFVILVATVIGIFGAVFIHDAISSRSVVIEPFETPRGLAERGLTGTAVASGILDQLTRLQVATRSTLQRRELTNAWSKEIKLTVPEVGISFGELSQLLKSRFGNDIHISGDVVQTEAGALRITVRGDGLLPRSFTGAIDQLDKLTTEAAEYAYSQSQPALWVVYLDDSGRYQEAIQFCQASTASSSSSDRPVLLTYWALAIIKSSGPGPKPLSLLQSAVALQPDYYEAQNDLQSLMQGLGDEEGIWRIGQKLRKLWGGRSAPGSGAAFYIVNGVSWDLAAQLAFLEKDAETSSGTGTQTFATGPVVAVTEAFLHDPTAAELALQTTIPDSKDPTIEANSHLARALLASEAGDHTHALNEWEAFLSGYSNPAVAWTDYSFNCWAAPAEEAAGHPDKADAILNTDITFVDCYRFHGDILDGRGDWKAAQEWYAKSVELAPDLPAGYYSWGVALAKHGDLAGAEAKLRDANQRGPHWAEPLKAWGDVLVNQGKNGEALAKYSEALKYAPNWEALKEARAALAMKKS